MLQYIYIFRFAHNGKSLKWYIFILQEKSNFLVVHNFTKYFSGTRVNQTVESLQFVIFDSVKNDVCKTFAR